MSMSLTPPRSIQQITGISLVMILMLAQTRLWPSVIGRLGENVGDSIFVLTFPLLGVASLGLLLNSRNKDSKIQIPLLGLLFVFWLFLTALWSLNPGLSIDASISALGVFAIGMMAGNFLSFRNFLLAIVYSSLIGLFVSLLLLWMQPSAVLQFPTQGISGGVSGVYLHKNYFGLVMAITAISTYLLPQVRGFVRIALVALFVGATFLSNASNAIGGMILGFVVIFTYQLLRILTPTLKKVFIVTGLAVIATLIVGFFVSPASYFAFIGRNPDFTGRTKIWESSWIWAEKQFLTGYGWGTDTLWSTPNLISQSVSTSSGFSVSHSHNSFIELILESGFIGTLLLLALITSTCVFSFFQLKRQTGHIAWQEPIAIVSILTALFVMSLFEVPMVQERGMFLIFTLSAMAGKFALTNKRANYFFFSKG